MKKLLFIAILLATLASCDHQTVEKKDLPIEVVTLKESQKFDTIYQIETDKKVYVFSKTHEYQGVYNKITEETFLFGFICGLILLFFGIVIIID